MPSSVLPVLTLISADPPAMTALPSTSSSSEPVSTKPLAWYSIASGVSQLASPRKISWVPTFAVGQAFRVFDRRRVGFRWDPQRPTPLALAFWHLILNAPNLNACSLSSTPCVLPVFARDEFVGQCGRRAERKRAHRRQKPQAQSEVSHFSNVSLSPHSPEGSALDLRSQTLLQWAPDRPTPNRSRGRDREDYHEWPQIKPIFLGKQISRYGPGSARWCSGFRARRRSQRRAVAEQDEVLQRPVDVGFGRRDALLSGGVGRRRRVRSRRRRALCSRRAARWIDDTRAACTGCRAAEAASRFDTDAPAAANPSASCVASCSARSAVS